MGHVRVHACRQYMYDNILLTCKLIRYKTPVNLERTYLVCDFVFMLLIFVLTDASYATYSFY